MGYDLSSYFTAELSIAPRRSNPAPDDSAGCGACEIPPHVYEIAFGWDPAIDRERLLFLAGGPVRAALELGCGAGRLLIAMAGRIERVAGIELSAAMAGLARLRSIERGVADRCTVAVGDMSRIEFDGAFDLVYCSANTIRHVIDDAAITRMWRGIADALRPGGAAVVDLELGIEYERGRTGAPATWALSCGEEEVRATWAVIGPPTHAHPCSTIRWTFEHRRGDGTRRTYAQGFRLRTFDAAGLRGVIEQAGLNFDGFHEPRDPYLLPVDSKHAAGRCLAVCRRPDNG